MLHWSALSFSISDQGYFNVDPQRWNNIDPTLKCWLENFCPDLLGNVGKRLDKKAKVNFKTFEVTDWKINNYNTDIAQYLKK